MGLDVVRDIGHLSGVEGGGEGGREVWAGDKADALGGGNQDTRPGSRIQLRHSSNGGKCLFKRCILGDLLQDVLSAQVQRVIVLPAPRP
jgi:hypothetical protein